MKLKGYLVEEKVISASVLMTDGDRILIVHPTGKGNKSWELPKGEMDKGESPEVTAVREFYEEVGVRISQSSLKMVGKFNLHKTKDVILFKYYNTNLPPTAIMKSLSNFKRKVGKNVFMSFPEIDNWKYITQKQINKYIRPEMRNMIRKAL